MIHPHHIIAIKRMKAKKKKKKKMRAKLSTLARCSLVFHTFTMYLPLWQHLVAHKFLVHKKHRFIFLLRVRNGQKEEGPERQQGEKKVELATR
jgi:hypothetical protein